MYLVMYNYVQLTNSVNLKTVDFSQSQTSNELFFYQITFKYRVSQKTWEFSDELDIVFVMNQHVIPNFKSLNNIMSAKVYFMKRVKDCKRCVYNVSARRTVKTDKFTLFVYCNFLVLLSTTVCSLNINKQNVKIAVGFTILNQRII